MELKSLSDIANSVVHRCSKILDTSVDDLVESFEDGLKSGGNDYSRKLVEYCSSKAFNVLYPFLEEKINDGSFTRLTYDMMLAWENSNAIDEDSQMETIAKDKEDKKIPVQIMDSREDIPLFYSDMMPLLVDEERNVGEDAFAWLSSMVPLAADVVNARFTFETVTAPTGNRLHFPAYDRFLREVDKCVKHLHQQVAPNGVQFRDDEFILHVEGTAMTHRVVRHIGGTSWPGRLTLTNYALYFEASGVLAYGNAVKVDLSDPDANHQIKPTLTGPLGAPIFDKAILYESSKLTEGLVLEFPELSSSTRRDHWLTLTKEIILLHQFISKYNIEDPLQKWETHARTILGIIRLHAARELLRIYPPPSPNFLIFTLFVELPKGDYVMGELANELKHMSEMGLSAATLVMKGMNMVHPKVSDINVARAFEETVVDSKSPLETKVEQVREEAKDVLIAKYTVEGLKEESIVENILVIKEMLSPLKELQPWLQDIMEWERPVMTAFVLSTLMLVIYKEWIGYAISGFLLFVIGLSLWLRHKRSSDKKNDEISVNFGMDQSMVDGVISAQHALNRFNSFMRTAHITVLKIHSLLVSRARKQSNVAMVIMGVVATMLLVVPFRLILMGSVLCAFWSKSRAKRSYFPSYTLGRRIQEWWDSIPVPTVRTS